MNFISNLGKEAKERAKEERKRQSLPYSFGGYAVASPDGAAIFPIATDRILPNPSQPRRYFSEESIAALAESIKLYGLIQPVTVRPAGSSGKFEIVEGERRFRAAKLLGLKDIPAVIIQTDSRRSAEISLTENLQRECLSLYEEAEAIRSFMEIYSLSEKEVAKRLSVSEDFIASRLCLTRLTPEEREIARKKELSEDTLLCLLSLHTEEERRDAMQRLLSEKSDREILRKKEEKKPPEPKQGGKQIIVLRDIKIFYNTLEKAIETMRAAGINVQSETVEKDDITEVKIKIPNKV